MNYFFLSHPYKVRVCVYVDVVLGDLDYKLSPLRSLIAGFWLSSVLGSFCVLFAFVHVHVCMHMRTHM